MAGCGHPQFIVVAAEQPLQKEIASEELMPSRIRAHTAENASNWRRLANLRHVAVLATPSVAEIAVQPLLVRHLLWERPDLLAVRVEGFRD